MKLRLRLSDEESLFVDNIYKEYHSLIFMIIQKFGIKAPDQEDVASAVTVSLMNNIRTLQEIPSEQRSYYIVRATISTAINFKKKQKRDEDKGGEDLPTIETIPSDLDIEELVIWRIELAQVLNCIKGLSEKENQCIRSRYLMGYNNSEIANITNLSETSVNQYIMRARRKIQMVIYGDEEE